ncbi:exodeoxyribonuclease V subunit alpha [Spiroplasma sabaudiense Ar-1343]|uniref:Exodeoxyribonuclease V subunit alpha n=1 Tax=Spiroplasma sabaudiense Ar-1343 TaxID=1276257 RepID=W6AAA0_9MOLU|nr:AAA family ATPase [Spiroplasma sabaudiense]AHI53936.1 exodeoxyribonuclease V subunit alpha [Spiroplasma sabaudiense Ar-1343]
MSTKKYRGFLSKFLFINESGWGIGLFIDEDNKNHQMRIKGPIGQMQTKIIYEIQGNLEDHPKYGQALEVSSFKIADSTTIKQAIGFLSSDLFPTIGKKTAEQIVDFLGVDAIKKIRQDPEIIKTVPDISHSAIEIITSVVNRVDQEQELVEIFTMNGLRLPFLNQMLKWHDDKNELLEIFKTDFYSYSRKNSFQPFLEVDRVSLYFGVEKYGVVRISAWIYEIIKEILFTTGHTFTTSEVLIAETRKRLQVSRETVIEALVFCKNQKTLVFDNHKIYSDESWSDEEEIITTIKTITSRANLKPTLENFSEDDLIQEIEQEIETSFKIPNFQYDDFQRAALKSFLSSNILILTGGPGTGKTMVINGMVRLYQKIYGSQNFALGAPTGRAASRITETTNFKATTIHKLLKASGDDVFEINASNPLDLDLIILDEASMLSNHLFADFLRGTSPVKKLVLVGDVEQLPSVSYGNLFEDLITANKFPTIKLTKIFRQKERNGIIELATAISQGQPQNLEFENLKNIHFLFEENNQINSENLIKTYQALVAKQPVGNLNYLQVICPYYKGELGINNLNTIIQKKFNGNLLKGDKIFKKGEMKFAINDKVMYLKNDSTLELSNGDMGIINLLKFENKKFTSALVEFNNRDIVLKNSNFSELTLSYAISVHKSQGSEYNNVILILDPSSNNYFLTKKIIYTAITRAKENLYIIGSQESFWKGLEKITASRKTTLVEKIQKNF